MRKLSLLTTLFLLVFSTSALAQDRTITGQVTDDVTGEANSRACSETMMFTAALSAKNSIAERKSTS